MNPIKYYIISNDYDNHWLRSDVCKPLSKIFETREKAAGIMAFWINENWEYIVPYKKDNQDYDYKADKPTVSFDGVKIKAVFPFLRRTKKIEKNVMKKVEIDGIIHNVPIKELVKEAGEWEQDIITIQKSNYYYNEFLKKNCEEVRTFSIIEKLMFYWDDEVDNIKID
jgi:hypothetical protein